MTRCDYDVIFYRVFCLSLLVIAFIFTVILTNVFVDIDGLLSRKDKAPINHDTEEPTDESTPNMPREMKPELLFNEDRNYEDAEDGYRKDDVYGNDEESFRNKRDLESQSFLFHLKNPNLKNVLTSHLNALLEQLEAEELNTNSIDDRKQNENEIVTNKPIERPKTEMKSSEVTTPTVAEINKTDVEIKAIIEVNDTKRNESNTEDKSQNEMLHLAMHDILLQGIIGHLDLNEVYKKINILTKNMQVAANIKDEKNPNQNNGECKVTKQEIAPKNEEDKFFIELTQCKKLQNEIREAVGKNEKKPTPMAIEPDKPKMTIRAIIDISGTDETTKQERDLNSKDIQGIIKFKYNGKPIKVKIISSSEQTNTLTSTTNITEKSVDYKQDKTEKYNKIKMTNQDTPNKNEETDLFESTPVKFNIPQSYLNKAIANFLKKYDHLKANSNEYSKSKRSFNNKRFKRHIKIHYDPIRNKTKSEDDELYVEIETHFDSKGMKGEKRKKLIRNLIEKIENAIHSNVEARNKTKKHYHAHVKKRIQNPLVFEKKEDLNGQYGAQKTPQKDDKMERRHVDPISKLVNANKKFIVPNIYDKFGESWKKKYGGPNFLTPTKSVNSAELSEVDVDYNRVLTFNGIPQRLQKPLNTEGSDEAFATNYYDLGNLKFFIKDIDHSGISVGFNQYTDEEPDPETIKIFTGVDSLVKAYNHNYGKTYPIEEPVTENQLKNQYDYNNNALSPDEHYRRRRSALDQDYHSNEYKIIYDTNVLPYKTYQEIFGAKPINREKLVSKPLQQKNITEKPFPMDIFDKKLKPSEIFSLANMLEDYRKKRSIIVKKFSNINTRRKLNKFLGTKTKQLFINKKRIKRHIDKIRIIATDKGSVARQASYKPPNDHNIFVVSNEDDYSNRAEIREVLQPGDFNERPRMHENTEEVYDYLPHVPDHEYMGNVYEDNPPVENYITHVFDGRSRHNPLMSKYPHVFLEEITKSKEMDLDSGPYSNLRNVMTDVENKFSVDQYDMPVPVFDMTTENYYPMMPNITLPIAPPNTKTKYKLSVKIMPKNVSELKPGFKEVHTSINKSYDKDGLRFFTLVNVSEISKVENIDNVKPKLRSHEPLCKNESEITTTTINPKLKEQQLKMKSMLKRHKHMVDLQLAQLTKEKEHLDHMLVKNQTDSEEVLDVKLPGSDQTIHLRKKGLSKLLASMMRINPNASVPLDVTTQHQTLHNIQTTTQSTTLPSVVTTANNPIKATDKKLINIIEKNGKLTKEILQKIDRNTQMLEAFLVKLIDKIEDKYDRTVIPIEKESKNETHYAIPFVYAFREPINQNKPNSPISNVYHGHIIHTDRQLSNEINKANAKIITKSPSNVEAKMDKNKFMHNDFKEIREAIVKSTTYRNPTSNNTTRS